MAPVRMHDDEVDTDVDLVRGLLRDQFPQWADLPVEAVEARGTDNAIYRLGEDLAVRLPRIHWATGQPDKERAWLPRLAPLLPLRIPTPMAVGEPGRGYPWRWSVHDWIPGRRARAEHVADQQAFVDALAGFVNAMRAVELPGGPLSRRGGPLDEHDDAVRASIAAMGGELDAARVTAAWDESLAASPWRGAPVWVHGDLNLGNVVADDAGQPVGVIDYSLLGVGDPACDLLVAWRLPLPFRRLLRAAVPADDDTWLRARGWALVMAVLALPYYRDTYPEFVVDAWASLDEILGEA